MFNMANTEYYCVIRKISWTVLELKNNQLLITEPQIIIEKYDVYTNVIFKFCLTVVYILYKSLKKIRYEYLIFTWHVDLSHTAYDMINNEIKFIDLKIKFNDKNEFIMIK